MEVDVFRTGWVRLWVVITAVVFVTIIAWATYYVWLIPPCYKFVSISPANNLPAQNEFLFESVKDQAIGHEVCSASLVDPLLTIEEMAKQGTITQVGIEWLEPTGWSMPTQSSLDVLNGKEITAHTIIADMAKFVRRARISRAGCIIGAVAIISVLLLVLGLGVAWVRNGFRHNRA